MTDRSLLFRITVNTALLLLLLPAFSGCTRFNCTRLEPIIGNDTDLIAFSYTIADELTASAYPPLISMNPEMPVLVTTFVDNNDLDNTSKFGRILQEHISSRLVQLGYSVKEIKMTGKLQIEPKSGEIILSRDLEKISPSVKSQAVLVGTTSVANRTMYVSARIIHPVGNSIISSKDYRLCMDDTMLSMFNLQRNGTAGEIEEPSRSWLNTILY